MRTSVQSRSTMIGTMFLVLGMVATMVSLLAAPADAAVPTPVSNEVNTCDGRGFPGGQKDESDPYVVSGDWGTFSASASQSSGTLALNVGWSVDVCIKTGAGQPVVGQIATTVWDDVTCSAAEDADDEDLDGVCTYSLDTDDEQGVSHIAWMNGVRIPVELPPVTVTTPACEEITTVTLPADTADVTYSDDEAGTVTATAGTGVTLVDSASDDWVVAEDGKSATFAYTIVDRTGEDCDDTAELGTVAVTSPACGLKTVVTPPADSAGVTYSDNGTDTVTATATEGFKLTDASGDWVVAEDGKSATFAYTIVDRTEEDCTTPVPTVAGAQFLPACTDANVPALDYDVFVDEQGDDELGTTTITVFNANGDQVAEQTVNGAAKSRLVLPPAVDASTLQVVWTNDGDATTESVELETCADVLGVVIEKPEPPAAPVVKGAVADRGALPKAGFEHSILLILGGGLLAAGCSLLLIGERRRTVLG